MQNVLFDFFERTLQKPFHAPVRVVSLRETFDFDIYEVASFIEFREPPNYLWSKKKYFEKKICILITFPIACEGSGGNL